MSSSLEWRPDFRVVPSWSAALLVSILHAISLLVVIWTMVSYRSLFEFGLCLLVAVIMSCLVSLASLGFLQRRSLFYRKRRICTATQEPTGEWRLHQADGSTRLYLLSKASVVSRFAIFLSFKPVGAGRLYSPLLARSLWIVSDSVDAKTYRRLHVWLRWQGAELLGLDGIKKEKAEGC